MKGEEEKNGKSRSMYRSNVKKDEDHHNLWSEEAEKNM